MKIVIIFTRKWMHREKLYAILYPGKKKGARKAGAERKEIMGFFTEIRDAMAKMNQPCRRRDIRRYDYR